MKTLKSIVIDQKGYGYEQIDFKLFPNLEEICYKLGRANIPDPQRMYIRQPKWTTTIKNFKGSKLKHIEIYFRNKNATLVDRELFDLNAFSPIN